MLETFEAKKIKAAAIHILGPERFLELDDDCVKIVKEASMSAFVQDFPNDFHVEYIRAALRSLRNRKGLPLDGD